MKCNIIDSAKEDDINHKVTLEFESVGVHKDLKLNVTYSKGKECSLTSETLELPLLISKEEEADLLTLLQTRESNRTY